MKNRKNYNFPWSSPTVGFLLRLLTLIIVYRLSQWPHGITGRSAAARLLIVGSNLTGGMDVFSVVSVGYCQVDLWDELIPRQQESYQLWCVCV